MHENPITDSVGRRVLVNLTWGLIQLMILATLFFAGGLMTAFVSGPAVNTAVPLGLIAGAIAGIAVNHKGRSWLQRLRLRGLRVHGVAVEAEVIDRDYTHTYAGHGVTVSNYIVVVRWTDPVTGRICQGKRQYHFLGLDSPGLESACAHGARVPVYYPAGRPSRFVIDIPYIPTMTDCFP